MHEDYAYMTPSKHVETEDKIRYVCVGGTGITPEKSTWKLEEVTCKNCLNRIHFILHNKDYRGKRKAVYDSKLYDEVEDCSLPEFCATCFSSTFPLCQWSINIGVINCPYDKLITKMNNGFKDCPECGGEKELIKTIPYFSYPHGLDFILAIPQPLRFIRIFKCKLCGHTW